MITKKKNKLKMSLALVVLGILMVLGCPPSNNSTGGAPTLVSSNPSADSTSFSANADIVLTYSEAVLVGTGNITITPSGGAAITIDVTDTTQVSIAGAVVTINPTIDLKVSTSYTLTIPEGAFMDAAGNKTAEVTIDFTTAANLNTTAPTVESSVPAQNGTALVGTNIVLTYSESVQAGSGNITITPEGGAAITIAVGDAQVNITGAVVAINPTNDLLPDIRYGVSIPAGALEDLAGNAAAVHLLTFNTTSNSIPSVSSSVPSSGAEIVNTANIVLTYSEAVQAATGDITITPASGSPITIAVTDTAQVSIVSNVVTINPTNDLAVGTTYTLTIPANTFESSDDQTDAGAFTLPFTAVADTTAPTVSSSVPAADTIDFLVDANIVLTYSEAVLVGTGNITILLSNNTGVTIPVTNSQVTIAGDVVTINPTNDLAAVNTYVLTIQAGAFRDAAGNTTAQETLSFSTAAVVDTTPPTVTSTVPANSPSARIGILDGDIVLTYSETVQAGSGNITITPMGRTATTIAVTDATQVSIAGNVVTIDPTVDLIPSKMYTVSIPAGVITDGAATPNNAALYELSFTTVAATRIVILWVAYSDVIGALVAENLFIVCGNRPPAVVQRSGQLRRFVVAGSGANQNPANFTLNADGTGDLLIDYSGATPVYAAHSGTTDLTDNDLVANSYADLFSPTTPLLRTFNQAGLNGTAEKSSNEPNQFWTGITNSGSPNGYVAGPACQLNDSGSFWNFNSTTSALGSAGLSNSVLKVPRVGNAARTDVMASTFGCRTTANILCMTY